MGVQTNVETADLGNGVKVMVIPATVFVPGGGFPTCCTLGFLTQDPSGNVVEYISTGFSTFNADPGFGIYATPVDIGVSEVTTHPPGLSLQKTGTGCGGDAFTWTGPVANTRGA